MKLVELEKGRQVVIQKLHGSEEEMRMLFRMGLNVGSVVEFLRSAPLGNPLQYSVDSNMLAIRREIARLIEVGPASEESSISGAESASLEKIV